MAEAGSVALDDQLKAQARAALTDDKAFERFVWQLFELVPQLDRVDVTAVDGDKLRLKFINERLGVKTAFHSKATVVKVTGQSLGAYAEGDKVVVNENLGGTTGSVMRGMATKDIRSSMHVPVQLDGQRATVNFWSAEPVAFPPEAVSLLEQVAHLMSEARPLAQK